MGQQDLLDWKLDFTNEIIKRKYKQEANPIILSLVSTALKCVISLLFMPLEQYIIIGDPIWRPKYYCVILSIVGWNLMWLPLMQSEFIKRNPSAWCSFVINFIGTAYAICNILVPNNFFYDDVNYVCMAVALIGPLVLRLRVKHCLAWSLFNYAIFILHTSTKNVAFHVKIGFLVPNLIAITFAAFLGAATERRFKDDFFRHLLLDTEAEKLAWTVKRDALLLQNIFPKNLSDELEKQLSVETEAAEPLRRSRSSLARTLLRFSSPRVPSTKGFLLPFTPPVTAPPTTHLFPVMSPSDALRDACIRKRSHSMSATEMPYVRANNNLKTPTNEPASPVTPKVPKPPRLPPPGTPTVRQNTFAIENFQKKLSSLSNYKINNYNNESKNNNGSDEDKANENGENQSDTNLDTSVGSDASFTSSFNSNSTENDKPIIPLTARMGKRGSLSVDIPNSEFPSPSLNFPVSVIRLPPVITTPKVQTRSIPELSRFLTTAGTPLRTPAGHDTILQAFLGAKHSDGTHLALSHSYPHVTVLFADIVGFTSLSNTISPQELVDLLNTLFTKFDDIIEFFQLEKIRTVGDAYLCVGNMSQPLPQAEEQAVKAGLAMIHEVHSLGRNLLLRVGIASGSLIAGVTGKTKWNYDIFGKPFEEATLAESMAPPDCLAVTHSVYDACKHTFRFRHINEGGEQYDIDLYVCTDSHEEYELSKFYCPLRRNYTVALLAAPEATELQKAISNISTEGILELQEPAVNSWTDLTLNFKKRFGYTHEDVEHEENNLGLKSIINGFKNEKFREEYARVFPLLIRKVTTFHSPIAFLFITVFTFFADLAITSNNLKSSVMLTYVGTICILLLYGLYLQFFYHRTYTFHICLFVMCAFGASFVLISYLDTNSVHLNISIITLYYMSASGRALGLPLFVFQLILALCNAKLGSSVPVSPARYLGASMLVCFLSVYSQFKRILSFQSRILAQRIIELDMYQQKVTQHRAKLLIRNILPEDIIQRLYCSSKMESISAVVDHFDATMVFINVVNLEGLTADLDASETFEVYNQIFTLFDEVTYSCRTEKIKTINTVYMVACGLPNKITDHADAALKLALAINQAVNNYSFPLLHSRISLRIGIASGPVIAGIIGNKKYAYDCWSDTVNTASRMESYGWGGHIQITPATYELLSLKKMEKFKKREKLNIKGKGKMDTYIMPLNKM